MSKFRNSVGLLGLIMGMFGEKINRDFALAQNMPHSSTFYRCSQPNQRRLRNRARRSIFASKKVKRGF